MRAPDWRVPSVWTIDCGPAAPGIDLLIVDEQNQPCGDGEIGEILVRGASIAAGYQGSSLDTAARFNVSIDGRGERWLRTADLGYLAGGELHVLGRLDDVIVWRGQKIAAEEIEAAARDELDNLSFCAAVRPQELVTVVCEMIGDRKGASTLPADLRFAISRVTGVHVTARVVPRGWIPRTSSGKVQRRACAAKLDSLMSSEVKVNGREA